MELGKESLKLMVLMATWSWSGDVTFQRRDMQMIRYLSHAKLSLLVASRNQDIADVSV